MSKQASYRSPCSRALQLAHHAPFFLFGFLHRISTSMLAPISHRRRSRRRIPTIRRGPCGRAPIPTVWDIPLRPACRLLKIVVPVAIRIPLCYPARR
jgi:hypothetical protein